MKQLPQGKHARDVAWGDHVVALTCEYFFFIPAELTNLLR